MLVLIPLAIVAAVLYGGVQYVVAKNGPRWSDEQSARQAVRDAHRAAMRARKAAR